MDNTAKKSKFLKWSLIIGIVIVLNLFFNYAISLAYPAPDYQKFCPNEQVVSAITTKQQCLNVGGQWNESTIVPEKVTPVAPVKPTEVTGYCNANYTCQNKYDAASNVYEKNVFIALIVLGVITLLLGLFLKISDAVTIALSLGGVLSLVIASIRYWSQAQNILKVVILAIALIALLWVGIKKFGDK